MGVSSLFLLRSLCLSVSSHASACAFTLFPLVRMMRVFLSLICLSSHACAYIFFLVVGKNDGGLLIAMRVGATVERERD